MAHFPATQTDRGTISAAHQQKLEDLSISGAALSIVWFHLLPQPASSGTPANATESGGSYVAKAKFIFDFSRLNIPNLVLSGKIYVRGLVASGNGDVQLFNVTDAVELGVINFTETVATNKTANLSSLPSSGIKIVELRLRKPAGGGALTIESASADFVLTAP